MSIYNDDNLQLITGEKYLCNFNWNFVGLVLFLNFVTNVHMEQRSHGKIRQLFSKTQQFQIVIACTWRERKMRMIAWTGFYKVEHWTNKISHTCDFAEMKFSHAAWRSFIKQFCTRIRTKKETQLNKIQRLHGCFRLWMFLVATKSKYSEYILNQQQQQDEKRVSQLLSFIDRPTTKWTIFLRVFVISKIRFHFVSYNHHVACLMSWDLTCSLSLVATCCLSFVFFLENFTAFFIYQLLLTWKKKKRKTMMKNANVHCFFTVLMYLTAKKKLLNNNILFTKLKQQ